MRKEVLTIYKPNKKNLMSMESLAGMSAKEVQKKFNVSQSTAYRWLQEATKQKLDKITKNWR